jgi:shikimate kinase
VSSATAGPAVVLVGPPGADLDDAGRSLGRLLGLPVRATDTDVEAAAGASVADIFVDLGEPAFRELERAAVAAALAGHDGVLVLGSGAVMDPLIQAELAGRTVAFLDVDLPEAARRLGFNRERPVAIGSPRSQWLRLMEHRRPVYRRLATVTVSTDGRGPDEVAHAVIDALQLNGSQERGDVR